MAQERARKHKKHDTGKRIKFRRAARLERARKDRREYFLKFKTVTDNGLAKEKG
jgi:hypothetical protein